MLHARFRFPAEEPIIPEDLSLMNTLPIGTLIFPEILSGKTENVEAATPSMDRL
jgi:hypothetical protein